MNKSQLVHAVSMKTWYNNSMIERVMDATFNEITRSLSRGEKVTIPGFGVFEPKTRAPRTGRNPHTDTPVHIPARIVPVFKPSKQMKDEVVKEV